MGPSIWQLLIVLGIVILVFGTKRIKNIGADMGGAIKNFRQAVKESENASKIEEKADNQVIEGKVERHDHREKV